MHNEKILNQVKKDMEVLGYTVDISKTRISLLVSGNGFYRNLNDGQYDNSGVIAQYLMLLYFKMVNAGNTPNGVCSVNGEAL